MDDEIKYCEIIGMSGWHGKCAKNATGLHSRCAKEMKEEKNKENAQDGCVEGKKTEERAKESKEDTIHSM